MRIGILGFGSLRMMQYLYKYTCILDKYDIEYDVYSWNRTGNDIDANFRGRNISFDVSIQHKKTFIEKLHSFFKYRAFLMKSVKSNNYDQLIILTTQTAFCVSKLLFKRYKNKYIYDYRDVTKEGVLPFYRHFVKKLIKNSFLTTVSSKGFLNSIGISENDKIIISHNTGMIKKDSLNHTYCLKKQPSIGKDKIRITYWGIIRQLGFNKKICNMFGNDGRFELIFHGNGCYKKLQKYCLKKRLNNVTFTGLFNPDEIDFFSDNTDIINCLYLNDRVMKNALQVKIYDAIFRGKPIIVSDNSYAAKFLYSWCGSFLFNYNNKKSIDDLYYWYFSLNADNFKDECCALKKQICNDESIFENELMRFVGYENK